MTELGDPLPIGPRAARNRLVFGPHETNLGRRRSISERHVAYYQARAAGGAGVVVVEEASVHDSDWPYERAPLARECAEGWAAVAAACHADGALVIAALGHAGGQGSSAYHQHVLWGPSRTPDVATREVPKAMEAADVETLLEGFAGAASLAVEAGCDGVELNAGQWSLLRQFASALTNQRADELGSDRARLLELVLRRVRRAAPEAVVGLRMSCDELAPWAGIVPAAAADLLLRLAAGSPAAGSPAAGSPAERSPAAPGRRQLDYVTIVRGSAYGTGATRPDGHEQPGFNRQVAASVRAGLPREVAVVLQGSVVDAAIAREVLAAGEADAVELTRAQIADPAFASKALTGADDRIRPCTLCNQTCQVRDPRNPIVTCIGEPRSGHETEDPDPGESQPPPPGDRSGAPTRGRRLLVVGAGPAGLECARVAAAGGWQVRLLERRPSAGGMVARAAARRPGGSRLALLTAFLESESRRLGVEILTGHEATAEELDSHPGPIVLCTGSRPGRRTYEVVPPGSVLSAADVLSAEHRPGDLPPGRTVVWDPVGGPLGVGVAELLAGLGAEVALVTPDPVAGEQLARTGDLAPANVRLAQAGVEVVRQATVRLVDGEGVTVESRFSGQARRIPSRLLVDAGHRLAEDGLWRSLPPARLAAGDVMLAGDAVAPRTIHEAVLEGRRAALALTCGTGTGSPAGRGTRDPAAKAPAA